MNQKINQSKNQLANRPIVWTALITPLLENGDIDFPSLTSLSQQQSDAGNGILLLGSTGEGLALNLTEQQSVVNHVCHLSIDTPIMVAVGGYDLNAQIEWIKECNHLSIHAFLLGSPIYAKPGPVGQEQWFKALLDAAERPCMLYNVPSRSCVELEVSVLQALKMHPNCWALKEASGDLNKFLQYRKSCPELELYSGEDAMVPYLVSADVKGLVSVCANVWPVETNRYVEMALAHQHQTLFPAWHNAITALFQVANPIPVKILMHKLNLINSAFLRPPLYVNELSDTDELITSNQKIQSWFSQNQPNMTDLDTMIDNHLHIKNKA